MNGPRKPQRRYGWNPDHVPAKQDTTFAVFKDLIARYANTQPMGERIKIAKYWVDRYNEALKQQA